MCDSDWRPLLPAWVPKWPGVLQPCHWRKGADAAAAFRKAAAGRLGRRYIMKVRKQLEQTAFPAGQLAACQRHRLQCRVCPVKDANSQHHPLLVEIDGTTFTARSRIGVGWGWLDKSALPCMVWIFWVLAAEPDIVLHERTPRFQHQQLADIVGASFRANPLSCRRRIGARRPNDLDGTRCCCTESGSFPP